MFKDELIVDQYAPGEWRIFILTSEYPQGKASIESFPTQEAAVKAKENKNFSF